MILYRIANWSRTYENSETARLRRLSWVPIPNKHDGLGFRLVAAEKDAAALLGTWVLLVQLASKSDKERRGVLMRDEVPLTARSMALITGFPEKGYQRALSFFAQKHIGWLLEEEWQAEMLFDPQTAFTQANRITPEDLQATPKKSPPIGNGMEWNGMEWKARGAAPAASVVSIPDLLKTPEFESAWAKWNSHRSEIRKPLKPTSARQALAQLARMGPERASVCILWTIFKGWQGLVEPDDKDARQFQQQHANAPIPKAIPAEPDGWRTWLNERFPDSKYGKDGVWEGTPWAQLPEYLRNQLIAGARKPAHS